MKYLKYIPLFILLIVFLSACNDDLQVKKDFGFTVSHLPVPKSIKNGETIEIRFRIDSDGHYNGTSYYLRYFLYDGKGTLMTANGTAFIPNDCYELEEKEFRLYYTSHADQQHNFEIVFYDNFGNEVTLEFSFNSDNSED